MEKSNSIASHRLCRSSSSTYHFRHWAVAFVVCNFNVDVGPEIELVYPEDTKLSRPDLLAICFNSFPERHETETIEDLSFNFTIPNNSPDVFLSSPCSPHGSASLFYGSCVFRQEYDSSTKRNFNQKTLVLLSNHNFPSFFIRLLKQMTAHNAISDPAVIETAYSQIMRWPPPSIGRHTLPFLGTTITLEIAPHHAFPLQGLSTPNPGFVAEGAQQNSVYVYEPLGTWNTILRAMPSISDLYLVYEKLLLCESVVVLAKSPQVCSEAVSCLVDLIRPVPWAGHCRPYMTMQSDFKAIGVDGGAPRPFIIGITNPFLLQRVVNSSESSSRPKPHIIYLNPNSGEQVPLKRHHSQHRRSQSSSEIPNGMDDISSAKRYLKQDRVFLHDLDTKLRGSSSFSDEIGPYVRRHFAELTAQFLAPLNRFLATSVSPSAAVSPGGNPQYANFSEEEFLKSLAKYGTAVKFRGQGPMARHRARDAMYAGFCRSPNFYSWLDMKVTLEKEATAGILGAPIPGSSGS